MGCGEIEIGGDRAGGGDLGCAISSSGDGLMMWALLNRCGRMMDLLLIGSVDIDVDAG